MRLYTIGFTHKSAARFFDLLRTGGVERVIDVRLHPGGQLSGFAKQDDLRYFLDRLLGCDYVHEPLLTPAADDLARYRRDHDWRRYGEQFTALMAAREVPASLAHTLFSERVCCLLCSEPTPEHCHRGLIAARLAATWPDVDVVHLS